MNNISRVLKYRSNIRSLTLGILIASLAFGNISMLVNAPIVHAANDDEIVYSDNHGNIDSVSFDGTNRSVLTQGSSPKISPDGTKLLFVRSNPRHLFVSNIDGKAVHDITPNANSEDEYSFPVWSPDSAHIAFSALASGSSGIFIMNADGSASHLVIPNASYASWSPDGSKLVYQVDGPNSAEIDTADIDGTNVTAITNDTASDTYPTWSPDGSHIAFISNCNCATSTNADGNTLVTVAADGTGRQQLVTSPEGGDVATPAWSPDSSSIVFALYNHAIGSTYYLNQVSVSGGSPSQISADPNGSFYPSVGRFNPASAVITSATSASAAMRTPLAFPVTTSGSPTPVLSEAGAMPKGITFTDNNDGTGLLAGMAEAGTSGVYSLTITANNGYGASDSQIFNLMITTAVSPPVVISAASDTEEYGAPFSFIVNTSGYPIPKITKDITMPHGITFTDNFNGTATISGTPSGSAGGDHSMTIKAKSSSGLATQVFHLIITRAPIIKNIPATGTKATVGNPFSLAVSAKGFTLPTLQCGPLPDGLTFVDNGNGTGSISGTPSTGTGGVYSPTVFAHNQDGGDTKTFELSVNEAPMLTSNDAGYAYVGIPFSLPVTVTGFPMPVFTISGSLPRGVSFKNATSTFTGVPKAGSGGKYPIDISVSNAFGVSTQHFTLVVTDGPPCQLGLR